MRTLFALTTVLLMGTFSLSAQTSASLDINQIEARVNVSGDLFWDLLGDPSFEAPKNSGKHTLFAGNLWIGTIDQSGQLRLAAQTYRQNGSDFLYGPVATTYDAAYDAAYNRLWKIEKADIDFHIANWENSGYIPAASIIDWPANGNIFRGESAQLAPFFDNDNDQLYDPAAGDHPLIRGDQAIFFMFNDIHLPHTETGGAPLGIEVHGMMYGYDNPSDSAQPHTVFMHYSIFNRSSVNLSEVYIGNWLDFDIGFYRDDYVGCDTLLETMYAYNGDNNDEGLNGYGLNAPAQGFTFLNHPMNSFMYYGNDFSGNENPTSPTDYYGLLTSRYINGMPVRDPNNNLTRHMYSGDPVAGTGWTEANSALQASDRRGIGVVGPFTIGSGESFCVDGAYVYGRDSLNSDHLGSISVMRNRIKSIRHFYNYQNYTNCNLFSSTAVEDISHEIDINIYPNPASGFLFIETKEALPGWKVELFDLTGRQAIIQKIQNTSRVRLETGHLPGGIYILSVKNSDNQIIARQKVVLE
ncbi:T9SS type A sorting domain-containing protein [bacterium]|nr:T9SS type A sorting domain-containing protein [bacterium]